MAGSKTEDLLVGCVRKSRRKGAVSDDGSVLKPKGAGAIGGEIEGQCLIRAEDRWSEDIGEKRVYG